ncbi:MAG: hypothetical protein AAFN92_12215 [Bacteroidota bacterium]
MGKQIILFCLLLCASLTLLAQDVPGARLSKEEHAKVRQARQAFITEKLELTEGEAAAFFPVFWEYEGRIRRQRRASIGLGKRQYVADANLPEAEALKKLMDLRRERQALLDLHLEAEEKYLEVLPAAKVVWLEAVEKAFRERLWERLRERRKARRGG